MGFMSAKQQKPAAPKPLFTCVYLCVKYVLEYISTLLLLNLLYLLYLLYIVGSYAYYPFLKRP